MIEQFDLLIGQILVITYYNNMNPLQDLRDFLESKTVAEASRQLGVSRQTIYNWLKGRNSFTFKNWQKIADKIK